MTDDQKAAFALLDQVLQPSTVAQLAAQGSREAWIRINSAVETLRPCFTLDTPPHACAPYSTSSAPASSDSPSVPAA